MLSEYACERVAFRSASIRCTIEFGSDERGSDATQPVVWFFVAVTCSVLFNFELYSSLKMAAAGAPDRDPVSMNIL